MSHISSAAVHVDWYAHDVFDDVAVEELAQHQQNIAADALRSARAIAANYLAIGPGEGLEPERILDALIVRDVSDPLYERLAPFEKRWAILVIRLLHPVTDPRLAVQEALARGATWAEIGAATGMSRQTAHKHFHRGRD